MSLSGEDVAGAFRKWLENEISSVSATRTDLGKFFFVSTGTLGLLVSLEKIGASVKLDCWILFSLLLFLASMVTGLSLARPVVWEVSSETDLYLEHKRQVNRLTKLVWFWFLLWLVAVAPWLYRILGHSYWSG